MNTCEKYGNTFSITKYGVKTYVDSKRRCLLCRSAPGRGIGTGRRPAGSYHSEQYREPAQPDRDLRGDHIKDEQSQAADACGIKHAPLCDGEGFGHFTGTTPHDR